MRVFGCMDPRWGECLGAVSGCMDPGWDCTRCECLDARIHGGFAQLGAAHGQGWVAQGRAAAIAYRRIDGGFAHGRCVAHPWVGTIDGGLQKDGCLVKWRHVQMVARCTDSYGNSLGGISVLHVCVGGNSEREGAVSMGR